MTGPHDAGATADLLARSDLFRDLPADVVADLAREVGRRRYASGTVVLRQGGEPSAALHLIVAGTAHVESAEGGAVGAPQLVEVCGEGEVFGAASLLQRSPEARARFTVRAVEDLDCLLIPRDRAADLVERFPDVADALAARNHRLLRRATAELARRPDTAAPAIDFGLQSLVEPLGSRVRREPVVCGPETTIGDAARRMTEWGVGSLPVVDAERRPVGIVTDSDLRRTVVAAARPVGDAVSTIMSRPVVTLRATDPALEALPLMAEHRIDHLVVVDGSRRIQGVVSSGDLLLVHASTPAGILRALDSAHDLAALAEARGRVVGLLEELIRVGVDPDKATRVITALNDRASRRALAWAEAEATAETAAEAGPDFAPPRFCWLALGSEGREEQTLATDQDNAIVHAAEPGDDAAARWLERFSARATAGLEALGFPRCPGDVMASNPFWRRSLDGWRAQVQRWCDVADERAMLECSIFFDFRPLFGDARLAHALRDIVRAELARNDIALAHLTRAALRTRPPLGLIRTFVVERGGEHRDTLDLKERGMAPLVDAARVLALGAGVDATNTFDRLAQVEGGRGLGHDLVEDAREAYAFLMLVRLQHHMALHRAGRPLDNHVNPDDLGSLQRRTLKIAFQVVQSVQTALADRLGGFALG